MTVYDFSRNHRRVAFDRAQREAELRRPVTRNQQVAHITRLETQRRSIQLLRLDKL